MGVMCPFTEGCTDVTACNYDIDAQLDNGTCISAFELYGLNRDCDGNCIDGMIPDACGICGGTNECCLPDVYDCDGVCGGDSWISDCGCVAGNNSGDDCDDCFGVPNGFAVVDECSTCVPNPDQTTALYCCDGELICPPNTLADCTNKLDDCDVCGGDGTSCDASILISDWKIWYGGVLWGFEAGSANNVLLNCDPAGNPLCIESNIEQAPSAHLNIEINASGKGFDLGTDNDPDLDIELIFRIKIKRTVEIGSVWGTCDDIYETEATATFDASSAVNGVLEFHFFAPYGTLPEDINLFKDVVIGGATYTLDKDQDFNAVYDMELYIESYNVIGYEYDTENIVVNDINNKIETIFNIHHDPLPDPCPGLLGDATGTNGITCLDYFFLFSL